ncbi:MAG TPA: hypothetical protein VMM76_07505 [Pirellulaceae bacterium]|nr:hypothetical protein [Pirellulaceae bacterium]
MRQIVQNVELWFTHTTGQRTHAKFEKGLIRFSLSNSAELNSLANQNVPLCTISQLVFTAAETSSIQQRARASAVLEAAEFLSVYLAKPRRAADVMETGMKRGLSRSSLHRARLRIKAISEDGTWRLAK